GRLRRRQRQQPRDRRRVLVFGDAREETGRRGRLVDVLDQQVMGGELVHVPVQRSVYERQVDARRDLLHGDVVGKVGTDAPVLLVEGVVDHPAAARGLEPAGVEGQQEA